MDKIKNLKNMGNMKLDRILDSILTDYSNTLNSRDSGSDLDSDSIQ